MTAGDLVARTRHPKIVAIGEAGLDYHYDNSPRDAQERGFRSHIAAARETGLPLVIHSRDADDDMARILEEETGKGAFPAVLHCFTGGPDLARRAIALGHFISFTGILTFKNSTALRDIAASLPADRILVETDAPYLAPGKHRGKRNEPAFVIDTANVLAEARGVSFDAIARQTTRKFLPPVRQGAAAGASGGMTQKFTILGCGSSGGVPRPALGWGACDPNNPKNRRRRTSLLVERRDGGGVTRILVDTSPDLREQLLDAEVDWLDAVLYTHEHADHTHGVDDLRALYIKQRRPIDVYLDDYTSKSMHTRFDYCFRAPPGSEYPPIVREHRLTAGEPVTVAGKGGPLTALPILQAARRHRFVRIPLRQPRLFLRPVRHAAGKRRGVDRPRRLDRRRAALPAAPEPFLARRRAGVDRPPETAARHPDQSARRSRLRGALRKAAGQC